jgi:nucleosome assembly protein 1-like 1
MPAGGTTSTAGLTAGLGDLKLNPNAKNKKKSSGNDDEDFDDDDDNDDDDDDDDEFVPGDDDDEDDEALAAMMAAMPPEVLARVLKLKGLEQERGAVEEDYAKERCLLEAKYRALYAPFYAQRAAVVSGATAVPLPEGMLASPATEGGADKVPDGIPKFWLQAMARRGLLAELIEEGDMAALGCLVDVRCVDSDKMDGFTLEFEFAPNAFFANKVLTKTYEVGSLLTDDEPTLEKVTGCTVEWKEGQNLCFEETQKKQRAKKGKNKGQVRYVTEKVKKPSFFHFFEPLDVDKLEELQDEAEAEAMMEAFNLDYACGSLLRTEVVPHAVLCFTGEMADDSDEEDDDEEGDEDEDDEDDDEDEDDEAGDDEDVGGKGGRSSKRGKVRRQVPTAARPQQYLI